MRELLIAPAHLRGDDQPMAETLERAHPSLAVPRAQVLILTVNFAFARAARERLDLLSELAVTSSGPNENAVRMTSEYDVIVLCPYLPERDRRALVAAARLSADPPTVIELHDSPLPRQVIGRGHYGASPLAERVLAALDAPRN